MGGQVLSEPFHVYARFLSVPMDVRRIRVSEGMPLDAVETLLRESFGRTYADIPQQLLMYTKVRVARGKKRTVLVEGVRGFLTPDCEVFVYPLDPLDDDRLPTAVSAADEKHYLG